MNKRRFLTIAIVAVVVVGGAAAVVSQIQRPQPVRPSRGGFGMDGPVPVIAAATSLADVPVYRDGVGTVRALNTVTVRAQVEGKLIEVAFKEGQDVKRGQVLARIDPTTFQAQLDQAVAKKAQDEATLSNARLDFERYQRLVESNSVARQQLDTQKATVSQLEALVKLDQAAIDNVRAILQYTTIAAPIDGRTGIRQVDEGNIVRGSDPNGIVVITQLRPISILFTLPQQQLSDVTRAMAKGPPAVEAFGPDNRSVIDRGTLLVVDNQVDQTTGTIKLKAEFPNKDLQLWPGQFVNVRLLIDTLQQVVVAPTAAVQRGPTGIFAFVVQPDNTVAVRPITVTQQTETQAVIATGLKPGERVVTTGFARLTAGSQVVVTNAEQVPPPGTEPAAAPRRRGPPEGRQRRSELPPGTRS